MMVSEGIGVMSQGSNDKSFAVRANRWTLSLTRHWLRVVIIVIGLYAGLPVLAPVLMHFGLTGPAKVLYTVYSPTCHQFAFRSWFLFGQQPVYPRSAARLPGLSPYENYLGDVNQAVTPPEGYPVGSEASLQIMSKFFLGNEQMGYKVAICERDVAIYSAIFFAALIYSIPTVRRHLRPVPWWLYILLGLGPIGIDGFSQLLSYPIFPGMATGLWPLRETTPFFRTITGALFGLMNAWLALPYLEKTAHDVLQEVQAKFARREQRLAEQKKL